MALAAALRIPPGAAVGLACPPCRQVTPGWSPRAVPGLLPVPLTVVRAVDPVVRARTGVRAIRQVPVAQL
jgi:hypothetical protein